MSIHSFDTDIAKEIGVVPAVILFNIEYWVEKNKANQKHFYDGKYWMYNSYKAFCELFPYLTTNQIRTALDKLIESGYIVKGNYNSDQKDRTNWYALTDNYYSLCEITNAFVKNHKWNCEKSQMYKYIYNNINVNSITDVNLTDINNTDINFIKEKEKEIEKKEKEIPTKSTAKNHTDSVEEIVSYLNLKADTKFRSSTQKTATLIGTRMKEGFTVDDFKTVIDKKVAEWKDDSKMCMYLRPETLFGTKFEGYLNQKLIQKGGKHFECESDRGQNELYRSGFEWCE